MHANHSSLLKTDIPQDHPILAIVIRNEDVPDRWSTAERLKCLLLDCLPTKIQLMLSRQPTHVLKFFWCASTMYPSDIESRTCLALNDMLICVGHTLGLLHPR